MLFTSSIKFPIMFSLDSGQTQLDSTVISINKCIALICTTAKGELLGDPDFGCDLYKLLFNNVTNDYKTLVKEALVDSLTKYESRINVNKSDIDISETMKESLPNSYTITIKYQLSNSAEKYSTTVRMEEKLNG